MTTHTEFYVSFVCFELSLNYLSTSLFFKQSLAGSRILKAYFGKLLEITLCYFGSLSRSFIFLACVVYGLETLNLFTSEHKHNDDH
jgi:hypothetical protein